MKLLLEEEQTHLNSLKDEDIKKLAVSRMKISSTLMGFCLTSIIFLLTSLRQKIVIESLNFISFSLIFSFLCFLSCLTGYYKIEENFYKDKVENLELTFKLNNFVHWTGFFFLLIAISWQFHFLGHPF